MQYPSAPPLSLPDIHSTASTLSVFYRSTGRMLAATTASIIACNINSYGGGSKLWAVEVRGLLFLLFRAGQVFDEIRREVFSQRFRCLGRRRAYHSPDRPSRAAEEASGQIPTVSSICTDSNNRLTYLLSCPSFPVRAHTDHRRPAANEHKTPIQNLRQERNRRAWAGRTSNHPLSYPQTQQQRTTMWGFDTSGLVNPGGSLPAGGAAAASPGASSPRGGAEGGGGGGVGVGGGGDLLRRAQPAAGEITRLRRLRTRLVGRGHGAVGAGLGPPQPVGYDVSDGGDSSETGGWSGDLGESSDSEEGRWEYPRDSRGSSSTKRESKTSFHDGVLEVVAVEGVLHLGQIQVRGRVWWVCFAFVRAAVRCGGTALSSVRFESVLVVGQPVVFC